MNPWVRYPVLLLLIGALAVAGWHDVAAKDWRLTASRLLGPGGRNVPLSQVADVRRVPSAEQIVTFGGDKHLILCQPDPQAVSAAILAQKAVA